MAPNVSFFKEWRTTFVEKHLKTFFGSHTKKKSSWSLWENICRQKSHKNYSGKFEEIWAKTFATPKFACSYTYGRKRK